MKLTTSSRLVKWAYLNPASAVASLAPKDLELRHDLYIPYRTSLCALFWRSVLVAPLAVVFAAAGLLALWPLYLVLRVLVFVVRPAVMWVKSRPTTPSREAVLDRIESVGDVITQFVQERKRKYCPTIWIESDRTQSAAPVRGEYDSGLL